MCALSIKQKTIKPRKTKNGDNKENNAINKSDDLLQDAKVELNLANDALKAQKILNLNLQNELDVLSKELGEKLVIILAIPVIILSRYYYCF